MKQHFLFTALIVALSLPLVSFAADYKPLVGIPGVATNADFNTYINSLYAISISIAALLAVIKIIIAGVKWMMSDVVTSKQDAKKDIQGALIGLIIVIAAVLILNVINSDITDVDLSFNAPGSVSSGSAVTAPPTLDPTTVKSFSVPGTATYIQYSIATTEEQKTLFMKSCVTNTDRKTNPQVKRLITSTGYRCIKYPPAENSYSMGTNCSVTDCQKICTSDTGTGVGKYLPDLSAKEIGYCVKPEYP